MYNISQELKDKLNSNAIISTARLTFSNPHFVIDGSNLVSVKIKDYCYNEGRIIGTNIAKDVEIIIQNDNYNLQDKEFFLEIGVLLDNGEYEYIPYGYYIIDTVGDTKSNNQYKITAMDYMIKLNPDFIEFDASEYPMTMRQFLNKFAQQCGIELAEQTLPNETLVIPSMPYFTKTSRRTVLKQIAEVFGRFAKFNRLGQLEFRLKNEINEKINRSNMNSKLEIDKLYGEVNVVSILLSDDVSGENVTLRDEKSIAIYGENIIKIVGNEFLSTAELREKAIVELFNDLKGFKYVPTSFKYMGKPYLDCGDTILVQDMDTDEYYESIVLNNYIEVPTLRQSKMENLALTKTQVDNQYVLPLEERVSKTEFNVNKVDKKMSLVVEEQTTQSNRITNVEKETNTVASNLNTFINETYSNDISNLQDQIDGAIQFWNGEAIPTLSNYPASEWTTEEQRNNHRADIYTVIQDIDGEMKQGKSYRFDKVGTTWQWVELTDNELSAVQALANSKAKVYVTTPTVPYNVGDLWLKDKELYECIKSKDASGSYSSSDWVKATKYTDDTKANEVDNKLTTTNEKVATIELNLDSVTTRVSSTETGIQENSESINQIENKILLTDTFERQKDFQIDAAENILTDVKVYGELEQETRSGKNLLHINNTSSLNGVIFTNNGNGTITINGTATASGDLWIANGYSYLADTYKHSFSKGEKITQSRNIISGTHSGTWHMRTITYDTDNKVAHWNHIANDMTYTTAYNGETRGVELYIASGATFNNLILFPQLEIGDIATAPEQYGISPSPKYPSEIKVIGDNINHFDISKVVNSSPNNIDFKIENNAITLTAIGTVGAQYVSFSTEALDPTETYRISCKAKKIVDMQGDYRRLQIELYYSDDGKTYTWVNVMDLVDNLTENQEHELNGTMTGHKYYRIFFYNYVGKSVPIGEKSQYYDIKIEKGTTQTNWTPYNCGGIDYKNVGKNYFDFSKTTEPYSTATVLTKEKNTLQIKGTATTYRYNRVALKVKAGTYTFQRKWKFISGDNTNYMTGVVLILQGFNGPELMNLGKDTNSKSFTVTEDCELDIIFYISGNVALTSETEIQFYDIQLEKGTKATDVEIHKEYNETITLPENEFMGKIGTYEDYIEGNILHKRIGRTILDGTETVSVNGVLTNTTRFAIYNLIDNFKWINKEISTHFQYLYDYNTDREHFYIADSSKTIWLFIDKTIATTADELKAYLAEQYANGTPVEIYYVLAEEYTRQIDKYTLPTTKGINNISVSAPLSATYYTNVDINSALTSKAEYAEQVIKVDEISTRVSSTETTVANQSNDISNINDNIGSLNNSVSANQQEITLIKEDYTDLKQTVDGFDFTIVDKIQQQIANGEITSNVVKTTTVAIDADGIKVAKSGSEMQSLLDNEGFYVNKGNIDKTETKNNILTVDKDGVVTENLYVRTYLTAGYHRTEGYIENGKKRTGVFYQGGVND